MRLFTYTIALLVSAKVWGQTSAPTSRPTAPVTEARVRALERALQELRSRLPPPASQPAGPISNFAEARARTATPRVQLTLSGYVELFYQWNFRQPANNITAYRGFDNRHNSLTIANAVLDVAATVGPVSARLALQVGHTPESYYLGEPVAPRGFGAGASDTGVWRFIQQANAAWKTPLGRGLLVEGGIFLSPIGPEGMAIKDQWNWSRSNLFFGLPFYHAGIRVSYPLTDRLNVSLAMYNGWNCVVDNNAEKSIALQLSYTIADRLTYQLIYFTGVERATAAAEGRPWRHLFDTYLAWYPRRWLSLLGHGNAGFERTTFGTSWWAAGALYARVRVLAWLYLAARGDLFRERAAADASGVAAPIFWPASWVGSATGTVEIKPHDNISLRVELRHDHASSAMYFGRDALSTGVALPSSRLQDTLTLGIAAWF